MHLKLRKSRKILYPEEKNDLKTLCVRACTLIFCLLLAACQVNPTIIPSQQPTLTLVPPTATTRPSTATPTIPPPRSLVVCIGQEPDTLYPYGASSRSMWGVLEAIFDGPIDIRGYTPTPVILESLPTLYNFGSTFTAVEVLAGDVVLDVNGDLVALAAGSRVYPSGCNSAECAQTWDGIKSLKMDQLSADFKLKPGIKWSDGTSLTAADSVYSFQVAADPATPVSRRVVDRTASYTALDALTARWVGKPGYIPAQVETNFWLPFPRHAWGKYTPQQLLQVDEVNRSPLGWGPYVVDEWKQGDHIRLRKNPNYFRAAEGLPKFDILVYRFLQAPADNNLAALLTGECDVVDQTSLLDEQLEAVLELQTNKKLKAVIGQGPEWEHLDFGIRPAAYEDGYYPAGGDRPDILADVRTRKAIAYCSDRQGIVDKLLKGQSAVPGSFFPAWHPLYLAELKPLPYDPAAGIKLLEEVGWKDSDNDPVTPRKSVRVSNVPEGTALVLNYDTTEAALRKKVAQALEKSLAGCGVKLNVRYNNPGILYAPGPAGILFGRKFDLAQFGWEAGAQSPCFLFESEQIPGVKNNWLGANITGYSSSKYDAACKAARQARPDSKESYIQKNQDVQRIFTQDMPALPLFFSLKIAVARPDFCGLAMDVTARSDLWNVEIYNYGSGCP